MFDILYFGTLNVFLQIVECRQKAVAVEQEEIRNIVTKEGIFFEIVQQNFVAGFRYNTRSGETLVHQLQRDHPELFVLDEVDNSSTVSASKSSQLGTGEQPKPIQSGLTYEKITKRQPTDKAGLFRACGLLRERLGQRVLQELWGGLSFGIMEI